MIGARLEVRLSAPTFDPAAGDIARTANMLAPKNLAIVPKPGLKDFLARVMRFGANASASWSTRPLIVGVADTPSRWRMVGAMSQIPDGKEDEAIPTAASSFG